MSEEPRHLALYTAALTHPAIDNHAHPLLRSSARFALPFEGVISEAGGDVALKGDARYTLACFRATRQLARLFGLGEEEEDVSWEDVKRHRDRMDYEELCGVCFGGAGVEVVLMDDGLGGVEEMGEGLRWHDRFVKGRTRRIVRVEVEAEKIMKELFDLDIAADGEHWETAGGMEEAFRALFRGRLKECAVDPDVAGFKSIVCYRTGLDVQVAGHPERRYWLLLYEVYKTYQESGTVRLANKPLNDYVVAVTLEIAAEYKKPVQFHTGLGDNDINLMKASPAHLQNAIKAFPSTTFVLLHSSYPYTREAGYLTAVYPNVYLDFGEVFPCVSGDGQRSIIRQVLELSPTNKIMWSSDGHWWPESYYLGSLQAREALYEVLSEQVGRNELTERQAVGIIENALYNTAARLYALNG
ncbi:hypothetical protein M413DRAFT_30568 [Hebeloma cylindrosporum]|uniref:Amidohydrolase-related domain-containing protein n=1 Tax=Hebeloma cylindrosporum TaxID=76867 RepID=A0A0C2YA53_HEBCY|nr:hypothetical protein M413DRAFT_30568 [Hebeloma cylindrosporum h7]